MTASTARPKRWGSKNCPEKTSAAANKPFLVHCLGRMTLSAARTSGSRGTPIAGAGVGTSSDRFMILDRMIDRAGPPHKPRSQAGSDAQTRPSNAGRGERRPFWAAAPRPWIASPHDQQRAFDGTCVSRRGLTGWRCRHRRGRRHGGVRKVITAAPVVDEVLHQLRSTRRPPREPHHRPGAEAADWDGSG